MPSASSMQRVEPLAPLPTEPLVEGSDTSKLRTSDLLRDNATLAAMIRVIATNHNALVDYVEQKMKEQQARLKAAK